MKNLDDKHINTAKISLLIDEGRNLNDWYIFRDKRHFGPFSYEKVTNFLEMGLINNNHQIWRPGFGGWVAISNIDEISCYAFNDLNEDSLISVSDEDFENEIKKEMKESLFFKETNDSVKVMELPALETLELKKHKKINKQLSAILLFFILGGVSFFLFTNDTLDSYKNLNSYQKTKLDNISQASYDPFDIRFQGYLSVIDQGDPVFVFASNLKKGTLVSYSLISVDDTLVGRHRLSIRDTVTSGDIFESKPLRMENGQFIPSGSYYLNVSCSTCDEKNILQKKIKYHPSGEAKYLANLEAYKKSILENKKLEISELENVITQIKEQLKKTTDSFSKYKGKKSWSGFSSNWLVAQTDLVNLFTQLEKPSMRDKIYYLNLYLNVQKLIKQTFEAHIMQSEFYDMKSVAKKNYRMKINERLKKIDLNLKSVSNDLENENLSLKAEKQSTEST